MLGSWLAPGGGVLSIGSADCYGSRIRSGICRIFLLIAIGLTLWVFACCAAECNGGNAVDKVAGFLFDCFALVVLGCPCSTVMAPQNTSLGFLNAARLCIDEC